MERCVLVDTTVVIAVAVVAWMWAAEWKRAARGLSGELGRWRRGLRTGETWRGAVTMAEPIGMNERINEDGWNEGEGEGEEARWQRERERLENREVGNGMGLGNEAGRLVYIYLYYNSKHGCLEEAGQRAPWTQ